MFIDTMSAGGRLTRRWASLLRIAAFVLLFFPLLSHGQSTKVDAEVRAMDDETFWSIIGAAADAVDESEACDLLEARLRGVSVQEIEAFELSFQRHHAAANQGDVWAAGVLLNGGHGTDDGFSYFRNWLIANGQKVYELSLRDPDALVDRKVLVDPDGRPSAEWELFGSVAAEVYQRLTGQNLFQVIDQRTGTLAARNFAEWDWTEYTDAVFEQKLPRLWEAYGRHKIEFDKALESYR
jgi:hypothetical protein